MAGKLASATEGMYGTAPVGQVAREKAVREWDDQVDAVLPADLQPGWRQDHATPAWHSNIALIEPVMTRDALQGYLTAKLAVLRKIIASLDG